MRRDAVGERPHVGELDLELLACRPGLPAQPSQHDHSILGDEKVIRIGPVAVNPLAEGVRESPDAVWPVAGTAPRHPPGQGPLDVLGDRRGAVPHVAAVDRRVDSAQRLDVVLGHGANIARPRAPVNEPISAVGLARMGTLEASFNVEVAAPRERCYAIAADIEGAPKWQGTLESIEV